MAGYINPNMVVFMVMVMVATMALCSSARVHTVGGPYGWGIPTYPNFYTEWASRRRFIVGDSLVFNFLASSVKEVSKYEYDNCEVSNPGFVLATSPAIFTLTEPGYHYYLSPQEGHCGFGHKLAVYVFPKGYSYVGV